MMSPTSHTVFREGYFSRMLDSFQWQKTPLQIYPLEIITEHLLFPIPLLQTDTYFIVFLHEGRYHQQIDTEMYDLEGPSVITMPIGTISAIKRIDKKLHGYFVLIENKTISSVINDVKLSDLLSIETVIKLNAENDQWVKTICDLLYKEISSETPNRKIGTALLQVLLHKIIELSSGNKIISRQKEIANKYKQLVYKNFSKQQSVHYYAQRLGISENYLNRCVKSEYNKTCKQIIKETAIQKSQIAMFDSSEDISEISYRMGFKDPSHFSRVFKQVTGQTPTEFKEHVMQGLS